MFTRITTICLLVCIMQTAGMAQYFSRISAQYSIKNKMADGNSALTMGRVYYDRNYAELVYANTFPEKEIWLIQDTSLIKVVNDSVVMRSRFPGMAEFTVFHLTLSQQLHNYGLDKQYFQLTHVEKDKDLVISTWEPMPSMESFFSKILVSNKDKRLDGLVFFNSDDQVISKQFFRDYSNMGGLEFPGKIIQIDYIEGKENYQITTFKDVKLNDFSNETYYKYSLPAN